MLLYTLAFVAAVLVACGESSKPFKTVVRGHHHHHHQQQQQQQHGNETETKALSRRTSDFSTDTNG